MCEAHQNAAAPVTDAVQDGRVYHVRGMTCEDCATSVTEEVEQVQGVAGVDVDVAAGRIVVRGEHFTDEAVHSAVDEAGYEVLSA